MILYFLNRSGKVLGMTSTRFKNNCRIINDTKKESVETGVPTLEADILFDKKSRADVENWTRPGNVVIRYAAGNDPSEKFSVNASDDVFTIIENETDVSGRVLNLYSEGTGLDLNNDLVGAYAPQAPQRPREYITTALKGTAFSLRRCYDPPYSKLISFSNSESVISRLQTIAKEFNCELKFGFTLDNFTIVDKWVDFLPGAKNGKDTNEMLRLNRELSNLQIKRTIEHLATGLCPSCKGPKDEDITLDGMVYDDGEYYIERGVLKSRTGISKWMRSIRDKGPIIKAYTSETANSAIELRDDAIKKLSKWRDVEENYEVDITSLPNTAAIGDRVNIIDNEGEVYLSGRILELETSISSNTRKATLGDYLIKKKGLLDQVTYIVNDSTQNITNTIGSIKGDVENIDGRVDDVENKVDQIEQDQVHHNVEIQKVTKVVTTHAGTKVYFMTEEEITKEITQAEDGTWQDSAEHAMVYGDMWYKLDPDTGDSIGMYRWNSTGWELIMLTGAALKNGTITAAQLSEGAIASASGQKIYYKVDQPSASPNESGEYADEEGHIMKNGDTWYKLNSSDKNKIDDIYRWDTTSHTWVAENLNAEVLAAGSIKATKISDGAIETSKLAAGAVTAGKIKTGTITANQIAANTITAAEIKSATITGNQIAGKTITAAELDVDSLIANSAFINEIASNVSITNVSQVGNSNDYHMLAVGDELQMKYGGTTQLSFRNDGGDNGTINAPTGDLNLMSGAGTIFFNAFGGATFGLGARLNVNINNALAMSAFILNQHVAFQAPGIYDTSVSGKAVYVNTNGTLGKSQSRRELKKDITSDIRPENDTNQLYNLRVRQFKYRNEKLDCIDAYKKNWDVLGFIAEEVAEDYPTVAYFEPDGTPSDWDERTMIPALVKCVQEQKKLIDDLTIRVSDLEKEVGGMNEHL